MTGGGCIETYLGAVERWVLGERPGQHVVRDLGTQQKGHQERALNRNRNMTYLLCKYCYIHVWYTEEEEEIQRRSSACPQQPPTQVADEDAVVVLRPLAQRLVLPPVTARRAEHSCVFLHRHLRFRIPVRPLQLHLGVVPRVQIESEIWKRFHVC